MEVSRYKGVDAFSGGPKAHLLDALECVSKPLIRRKRRSLPRACGGSEGEARGRGEAGEGQATGRGEAVRGERPRGRAGGREGQATEPR